RGAGPTRICRELDRGGRRARRDALARRARSAPDGVDVGGAAGAMNGVTAYGHWGRPVLAFPSEAGDAGEFERHGMVGAIGHLLEEGRVKLYCVDSFDHASWANRRIPLEERARRHAVYEGWILGEVVPFVRAHSGGGAHEL